MKSLFTVGLHIEDQASSWFKASGKHILCFNIIQCLFFKLLGCQNSQLWFKCSHWLVKTVCISDDDKSGHLHSVPTLNIHFQHVCISSYYLFNYGPRNGLNLYQDYILISILNEEQNFASTLYSTVPLCTFYVMIL